MVNLGAKSEKVKFAGETPSVENLINLFTGDVAKLPKKLNPGEYLVFIQAK
jgi:hypothetical protein